MIQIKATVFLEGPIWVGTFERTDIKGYAIARKVFGSEPSDIEIYEFVLNDYQDLQFGAPGKFTLEIKRKNHKRMQREIRKEMEKLKESTRLSTIAQDYMRLELEKNKKEKRALSLAKKEELKEEKFLQKKHKRKEKHRGH